MKPAEGRKRVVIEEIQPQVDCGRYPARRILGDCVEVSAAIFCDGHDHVAARVLYKADSDGQWQSAAMTALPNDLWHGSFTVDRLGPWSFTIQGWVDHFDTWTHDLKKRLAAQPDPSSPDPAKRDLPPQDIPVALTIGALLVDQATLAQPGGREVRRQATQRARRIAARFGQKKLALYDYPLSAENEELVARYPDLIFATTAAQELPLWVDRERARFSSWYELFPRSASPDPTAMAPSPTSSCCSRDRRHGLRHPLPAAHPPHRPRLPQRPQQQPHGRAG
jgi:starch synthase (maltosyl-transferring)